MKIVECGCTGCIHNKKFNQHYGNCECPENIILKFRLAVVLDKGSLIMMECLNMQLPEEKAAA